jgi:hypothetical protein
MVIKLKKIKKVNALNNSYTASDLFQANNTEIAATNK